MQALLEHPMVALGQLARPADGQLAYLTSLGAGTCADELALEFDDGVGAVLSLPGLLTRSSRASSVTSIGSSRR